MKRGIEEMVDCPRTLDAEDNPIPVSYVWTCLDCKFYKGRKHDSSGIPMTIIYCGYGEVAGEVIDDENE